MLPFMKQRPFLCPKCLQISFVLWNFGPSKKDLPLPTAFSYCVFVWNSNLPKMFVALTWSYYKYYDSLFHFWCDGSWYNAIEKSVSNQFLCCNSQEWLRVWWMPLLQLPRALTRCTLVIVFVNVHFFLCVCCFVSLSNWKVINYPIRDLSLGSSFNFQ